MLPATYKAARLHVAARAATRAARAARCILTELRTSPRRHLISLVQLVEVLGDMLLYMLEDLIDGNVVRGHKDPAVRNLVDLIARLQQSHLG